MHDCNEAEQKLLKLYHDISIGTCNECNDCHDKISITYLIRLVAGE
jgi:hypothetical protein